MVREEKDLTLLGYCISTKKQIATLYVFNLKCFPSTAAPTRFHIMCEYLKVQHWVGKEGKLDPKEWGQYEQDQIYLLILTDIDEYDTVDNSTNLNLDLFEFFFTYSIVFIVVCLIFLYLNIYLNAC